MQFVTGVVSFVLHIDSHLADIIGSYGAATYAILFAIIFAETGFVFTPFLPGDSLLFAAGAFAALGSLNIYSLLLLLFVAAFLGDTANYWIGHFFGERLIANPKIPITPSPSLRMWLTSLKKGDISGLIHPGAIAQGVFKSVIKKEHIEKTQKFFEKYGGKTIILARFVPIVRTFAPFVAGVGKMHYGKFISFNIIGGLVWVLAFTLAGFFFGNIPSVKENFTVVILVIIGISVVPMFFEIIRHQLNISRAK